jgi:DNA-binding GntR family transcriptional regulator
MILEGELAPGEQIVESSLCEGFGVSRTPLREALKVLASEGLVELRPRRTPVVTPVDPDEIAAIFEVMEGLEGLAGRRAAENATPPDLARLEAMHEAMVAEHDKGERATYAARNREIHAQIVALAGNPVLSQTYAAFNLKIHRARSTTNYDSQRWKASVQEHERIMQAFRTGTPHDVAAALVDHTRRTAASVIATLLRVRRATA